MKNAFKHIAFSMHIIVFVMIIYVFNYLNKACILFCVLFIKNVN